MKTMTQQEYNKEMKRIKLENIYRKRMLNLKKEKEKYKSDFKLPSTSKLILLVVILLCLQIVFFAEYIMLAIGDTSSLYVLIGVPVTLVPIIWGYYSKSKTENSVGGITYDIAMAEFSKQHLNIEDNIDNKSDGVAVG